MRNKKSNTPLTCSPVSRILYLLLVQQTSLCERLCLLVVPLAYNNESLCTSPSSLWSFVAIRNLANSSSHSSHLFGLNENGAGGLNLAILLLFTCSSNHVSRFMKPCNVCNVRYHNKNDFISGKIQHVDSAVPAWFVVSTVAQSPAKTRCYTLKCLFRLILRFRDTTNRCQFFFHINK